MLACNIMWGLMSPVAKEALSYFGEHGISPVVLPTLRMLGATVCFWVLSIFCHRERVERGDWPKLIMAGLLSIAFNQNLFVCGISYTSPVDASVVTTMLPIVTMILAAIVLGEPISGLKAGGVAVGMTGALILVMSNGAGMTLDVRHAIGDAMCFGAQISFACYLVFCKEIIAKYSPVTLMKWMFLTASVITLPFTGSEIEEVDFAALPRNVILQVCYVVFIATFVTFLIVPIGQKLLRPTVVSSYNYIQPVVATTASLILGIATFGWMKAVAVALVFTGVILVTRSRAKTN